VSLHSVATCITNAREHISNKSREHPSNVRAESVNYSRVSVQEVKSLYKLVEVSVEVSGYRT
jgi:hypothetical protein